MSNWKLICKLDDIPQLGSRVVQRATGGDIAVFRTAGDEVFAMHSTAMATGEKARLPLLYAANFTSHSGWIVGTFIGAVAGDFLPDPKLFGLDYALPAMFLALLVPQCKERLYTLAAVLSALLSVILAMYDTGRWNVIIASVITSTIGALLVTHRDRNIDALRRKA